MLRIRKEQLDHFADLARAQFVAKMRAYLRESYGDWVVDMRDDALVAWLRRALAVCERHGVVTEPEAAQLVLLLLLLGVDADTDPELPWVREVLTERGLAPEGKVRLLIVSARERAIDGLEDVVVFDELAGRAPAASLEA